MFATLGIVIGLGVYALLTSYYLALSISMQEGLGMSALGAGLVYTPAAVAPEAVGMAAGVLSTARQIGGALGVAVIGAVFFTSFHPEADGRAEAAGHAFAMSSLTTCTIAVRTAVLVFLLPAKKTRRPAEARAGRVHSGAGELTSSARAN
ncbi:hypothetical protein [Streptomyces sp. MJM1172]|uniref:hypothetical protein n=1 Tax=Streptomyces sp. MJM1172 TaxID=1703926 RepID=UPI00093EC696|nr:hypothetical protein [Streptomyces sp. MJM1172]OKI57778.1 hypothetical protein AMK15_24955 [Streptomyces sp. MJM1172]